MHIFLRDSWLYKLSRKSNHAVWWVFLPKPFDVCTALLFESPHTPMGSFAACEKCYGSCRVWSTDQESGVVDQFSGQRLTSCNDIPSDIPQSWSFSRSKVVRSSHLGSCWSLWLSYFPKALTQGAAAAKVTRTETAADCRWRFGPT